jgi:hypothetical protein
MNALVWIFNPFGTWKCTRLAKQRLGQDFFSFQRAFENKPVSERVLKAVYDYFQSAAPVDKFPVLASDGISDVYGICDEDLDDAFLDIARTVGCRIPEMDEMRQEPPVKTVADLAILLSKFEQVER